MQSMRDIRQRISSVRDIQHITRAMKMVSVAKLHRTEIANTKADNYHSCIEQIYDFIVSKMPRFRHPFFVKREGGKTLVIAIASDKGLCGGYNNDVVQRVRSLFAELGEDKIRLIAAGKKFITHCRARGWRIETEFAGVSSRPDVRFTELLAKKAIGLYMSGEVSRVAVVLKRYKEKTYKKEPVEYLLPLRVKEETKEAEGENYLYEPDIERVIGRLLNRLITDRLFMILLEAQLSEHLARMQAMENASGNAVDLIDELTLSYNKARQSSITSELIDIIGGAQLSV